MKKASANEVTRGQTISFRIPSDTPDHLIKQLQRLKENERRNFSGKIAEFVMEGVGQSYTRDREMISIPLPQQLTKAQRNWLKHEHSEALLGSIMYHLISDPIRATALLASLNSRSIDIDEALYLQEERVASKGFAEVTARSEEKDEDIDELASGEHADADMDDDLDDFDWETANKGESTTEKEDNTTEEMDIDDILGDFLASMNK